MLSQSAATQGIGNGSGDRRHALRALTLRAELVVIDDLAQPRHTGFERFLAILIEEKLCIGQTRPDHAFVSADHCAGIGRADVADHQKFVRQFSGRIQQRKILLVGLHGEDQALLRHGQEFLFKLPHHHVGPLHQGRHLIEQRVVVNRLEVRAGTRSSRDQLARNFGPPFGKGSNHRTVTQHRFGINIGVGDADLLDRRFKAMALGLPPGQQPQHRHRHHLFAMQGHQRVRRTHKIHRAPAIRQLVGHHFGNRQRCQSRLNRLLQAFGKDGAFGEAVVEQDLGLAVIFAPQARHGRGIGPQRRQFFQQGGRAVTLSIEAHRNRHEFLHHGLVRSDRENTGDMRGQSARTGESRHFGRFGRQSGVF